MGQAETFEGNQMTDETLEKIMEETAKEDKKIEEKAKKGEFITAGNYDQHLYSKKIKPQTSISDSIKRHWNILGTNVIVECPNCGRRQPTTTCLSKKCVGCSKSFMVYPKNKPSRVIYCPKNLKAHLFTVCILEIDGKYPSIL